MIKTERLILIPATLEMLEAEIKDKSKLSDLLNAHIPESWPPETLKDAFPWFIEQLKKNPGHIHWYIWYALLTNQKPIKNVLVGSVGFKGYPDESGKVEIGYSVLAEYQNKGIASEMTQALVNWAFSHNKVNSIIAETTKDNITSIRVLEKNGFSKTEQNNDSLFFSLHKKRDPVYKTPYLNIHFSNNILK